MEFGIHLPNSGPLTAAADLVGMARRAEELGFATAWVFDHLFNPAATPRGRDSYHNKPDMPYYDALTLLSVVAGATQRIKLGTRVLIPVLRNPVALAKQIGTLAALAGPDRVILGVGGGWLLEEFESVGVPPEERFARFDEHIAVMRNAWSGETVSFEGRFYAHPPAGFLPKPPSKIPILVGGSGDVTLRRVARWADGWALPTPAILTEDELPDLPGLVRRLREVCEQEGRDVSTLVLASAAPLDAPRAYFDLLAENGIHLVDLMLNHTHELDLVAAERFQREVAPHYQ